MVKLTFGIPVCFLAATALTPAFAAPPPGVPEGPSTASPAGKSVGDNSRAPINQRFANLDAYLAHLQKRSHVDGAWYREIRPGVYELQTGNLRLTDGVKRQRIFTREELEKKFGFAK